MRFDVMGYEWSLPAGLKPPAQPVGHRPSEGFRDRRGRPDGRSRSLSLRRSLSALLLLCGVALAGPLQAASDESKVLREQAVRFWEARVKGDWATVYDCLPEEQRGGLTKDQFVEGSKQRGPYRYLSYKMGAVEAADDMGWVKIEYSAEPVMFPGIKPTQKDEWEIWEKAGSKWWPVTGKHIDDFPPLPPSLRPAKDEKAVKERAEAFWKASEKGDYLAVYQLCEPDFHSRVSQEEWLEKKARNIYLTHRILWVFAQEDRAIARVAFEYRPNDPNLSKMDPREEIAVQRWVKVDGQWYLHIGE